MQVKPSTLQVNLSSCCVVPQELSSFAQQNDVQVLTHNDAAGELCVYTNSSVKKICNTVLIVVTNMMGLMLNEMGKVWAYQCRKEWLKYAECHTLGRYEQCVGMAMN